MLTSNNEFDKNIANISLHFIHSLFKRQVFHSIWNSDVSTEYPINAELIHTHGFVIQPMQSPVDRFLLFR